MAKAFRFRLERLLGLRRLKEEIAQRDLADSRRLVLDENQAILRMLSERDRGKEELKVMRAKELDLGMLRVREAHLDSLECRIREAFDRLQDLVRSEIGMRRALTEAVRGVKVLDRLRSRRLTEWARGLDRAERESLDEAARRMERAL